MATYIKATVDGEPVYYQLDATKDIRFTTSGRLTSNPVQNGASDVADHYNQDQDRVSFNGLLTKYKAQSKETEHIIDPKEYIAGIRRLKNEAIPVEITIFQITGGLFRDDYNPIETLKDYILESVELSKQSGEGSRDLSVSITARQATFADQTEVKVEAVTVPEMADNASQLTTGATSTEGLTNNKLIDTVKKLGGGGLSDVTGGIL